MSYVILQPSGNKDARSHYVDTIENPVKLEFIKQFITLQEYSDLRNIYPDGNCYVWGVTPGGNNITKWNRISRGDVTLFSRDGGIYASGVTTYKLHSKQLAEKLWGYNSDNETWEYVYFLEEIKEHDIKYIEFNNAVGYADNFVIQGFSVLDEEKSNKVLDAFSLESDTFIKEITEEEYGKVVNDLESLEETEKKIVSSQRLEQSYLKKYLFGNKTLGVCACCGKVYPVSFLITAHVKKRSECNHKERLDKNVVIPMCRFGCDELFEKGYIIVEDGKFLSNPKSPSSPELLGYLDKINGRSCVFYNENTKRYFEWHKDHHNK